MQSNMHFSALVYVSIILQYPNSNIASTSLLTRNNNGVYGVGFRVYYDALLHLVYNLLTCFCISLTYTFVKFFFVLLMISIKSYLLVMGIWDL